MGPYSVLAIVADVRPMLGQWAHEHLVLAQILIGLVWVLCFRAAAMDFAALEADIAAAMRYTLQSIQMPEKVAADLLGMNLQHFQQALRREQYRELSIFKLARLPWSFWAVFLPSLSAIVLRHHVADLVTAVKDAFVVERKRA